jgi:hypothetical protein
MIVVQALDEIGLAIVIEMPKDRELIATRQVNGIVEDLQSQRLVQTGCDPLPTEFSEFTLLVDSPNITVPRADPQTAVGKEIEAGEPHLREPWVWLTGHQRFDRKGPALERNLGF